MQSGGEAMKETDPGEDVHLRGSYLRSRALVAQVVVGYLV